MRIWAAAFITLTFVIPLALATTAPGLALAAWMTPLKIMGAWTFIGASAITVTLTICFGASRPLIFVWDFVGSFAPEEDRRKSDEANRAFRESRRELGDALGEGLLHSWSTHRAAINWVERCLRVAAMITGTVRSGFWFGVVLAVIVWLLPALHPLAVGQTSRAA